MAQSYHFFANSFAGSLVRKINRLSGSFEEIADQMTFSILPLTITIVGTIIGVSFRSRLIAAIIAGWIIAFIIIQFWYSHWKQPVEIERAERDTESTGALADALSNSSTIRMFTGFIFEIGRYRATLQRWQTAMSRAWLLNEYGFAAQALSMAVVEAVVLVVAVRLWGRGVLTVGDFVLLQTYLSVLFRQLWDISRVFRRIYTSIANAAEIVEVMQATPDVMDKLSARPLQIKQAAILFRGVDFSYHKTRKILSKFTLDIKAGDRIALVGASGAGKTTITNLLLRLYDVEAGAVLIDDQNIADVTQESLREAIAFVPQEPILFHRTLMENIRYGRRDATDAEVI